MEKRSDMSRRGKLVARAMLRYGFCITVAALVIWGLYQYVVYSLGPFSPDPETYNKQISPKHARIILDALNRYYEGKGVYPDYILGGEERWSEWELSPDPLLKDDYIKAYPTRFISGRGRVVSGFNGDPRGGAHRIKNLVSSPNDGLVQYILDTRRPLSPYRSPLKESSSEEGKEGFAASKTLYQEQMKAWKYVMERGVLLAAGGVRNEYPDLDLSISYSAIPSDIQQHLKEWGSVQEVINGIEGDFGYVRGEHMESDEKSAYLWMYGMLPDGRTGLVGLDILNAETGELKPDGLPDGIVLLYELQDGEVVNITLAEDM